MEYRFWALKDSGVSDGKKKNTHHAFMKQWGKCNLKRNNTARCPTGKSVSFHSGTETTRGYRHGLGFESLRI